MKNILLNTEWQIITTQDIMTIYNYQATGTLPMLAISGFTAGTNLCTFSCSNTSQLKNGDLLRGYENNNSLSSDIFGVSALRVQNLIPNVSFKAYLPRGAVSPTSRSMQFLPIQRGDMWGVTGDAANYWHKAASDLFYVDAHPQNQDVGTKRVACIIRKTNGASYHNQTLDKAEARRYAGQPLTVKYRVKSNGSWRVYINDNGTVTYGATESGSGYIESQVTVPVLSDGGNVTVGVDHQGAINTYYYYGKPMLANEPSIPANYYSQSEKPLSITVGYSLNTLRGSSITLPSVLDATNTTTYGWPVRFHEESYGVIADDIKAINCLLEFNCANPSKPLAFRNQELVPHIYGAILTSSYSGSKAAGSGKIWVKDGAAFLYTDTAGQPFTLASLDMSEFEV